MKLFVFFCVLYSSLHLVSSACTFPSALEGTWESPEHGTLTINSTAILGYDVGSQTSLTFGCEVSDSNNYVIRSSTFTILSNSVNAVTCLSLTAISSNKYSYFLLTTELTTDTNETERVRYVGSTTAVTTADSCDQTSVANDPKETKILIKSGSATSEKVQCPDVFLAQMTYVNHTTCNQSFWDGCTSVNDMTFNYTLCSEKQAYSTAGYVYCVYSTTSGSTGITYVYNSDTSVDDSTTFRFTCLMAESTGGYIYMSQNPGDCDRSQNSTWAPSGGKTMILETNFTCVPTTSTSTTTTTTTAAPSSEETSNAGLVAGLVVVFIILIAAGVAAAVFIYIKKFKKVEPEKRRVIDREVSNESSRKASAVTPSVVHPDVHGNGNKASHGKIKIKRVPIKRDAHPSPSDDTRPAILNRINRRKDSKETLITPRTQNRKPPPLKLKAISNRKPATPRDIPKAQKVEEAPIPLQLNLQREESFPSFSRASTVHEDKISLSLKPDTPLIRDRESQPPKTPSTPKTPNKLKKPKPTFVPRSKVNTPSTSHSTRKGPSMSVKPLQKPGKPPIRKVKTNVVFKDSFAIYKKAKAVKLVGKVQKKKASSISRLVAIKENVSPITAVKPAKKKPYVAKPLDLSKLFKDLKPPAREVNQKSTEVIQEVQEIKQEKQSDEKEIEDKNFFSVAYHNEINDKKDTIDSDGSKLENEAHSTQELGTSKADGLEIDGQTNKIRKPTNERKTTTDFFTTMVKEAERVARRNMIRRKIQRELSRKPAMKSKVEEQCEEKVFSKVIYNHDLKPNSKVRQRRKQSRKVDLGNRHDFKRIPTLLQWVECSDVLMTPAMKMQNRLFDGSINRDIPANQKFSSKSIPLTLLTEVD